MIRNSVWGGAFFRASDNFLESGGLYRNSMVYTSAHVFYLIMVIAAGPVHACWRFTRTSHQAFFWAFNIRHVPVWEILSYHIAILRSIFGKPHEQNMNQLQ